MCGILIHITSSSYTGINPGNISRTVITQTQNSLLPKIVRRVLLPIAQDPYRYLSHKTDIFEATPDF